MGNAANGPTQTVDASCLLCVLTGSAERVRGLVQPDADLAGKCARSTAPAPLPAPIPPPNPADPPPPARPPHTPQVQSAPW
jgi:hypothetical protein